MLAALKRFMMSGRPTAAMPPGLAGVAARAAELQHEGPRIPPVNVERPLMRQREIERALANLVRAQFKFLPIEAQDEALALLRLLERTD